MPDETIWERSPHTAIKHQLLHGYLGGWLAKLAWTGRVLFIDGFAGPGRYRGGEEGSPLIALRLALEHRIFRDPKYASCERILVFIENDPARFAHLQEELHPFELPAQVKIAAFNVDFEQGLTDILGQIDQGRHLAPAFIMVDPFGWTGFPFSLVERIAREPRSEVLVSFMIESIVRWIEHPQQEANLGRLFGSDEWRAVPRNATPEQRRDFLVSLYQNRLRAAGLQHQWRFELRDEGNRPEYYLVFGSQSLEGLALMKETMWRVAPDGSFRYSDYEQGNGQMKLFLGDPDPAILGHALLQRFASAGELRRAVLREFVLNETDYVDKHLNAALKHLEGRGDVAIRRPPGRNRAFFREVWVTFT